MTDSKNDGDVKMEVQSPETAPSSTDFTNRNIFQNLLFESICLIEQGVVSHDSKAFARSLRNLPILRRAFQSDLFVQVSELFFNRIHEESMTGKLLPDIMKNVPAQKLNLHFFLSKKPNNPKQHENLANTKPPQQATASKELAHDKKTDSDNLPAGQLPDQNLPLLERLNKKLVGTDSMLNMEIFFVVLALMVLVDIGDLKNGVFLANLVKCQLSESSLVLKLDGLLVAKAVYYIVRVNELDERLPGVRKLLMDIYRLSVIHREPNLTAVSLNSLLRNFLRHNLTDQAIKLLDHARFPENNRSNAQHARFLYYVARMNAIRLNYGEAHLKVTQALRKGPQEGSRFGKGFRLASLKLSFVIELLMGEIPDRRLFNDTDLRQKLHPYARVVQAVRSGDLLLFERVMLDEQDLFLKDGNDILIQRLYQNVIRAGLRKIAASYLEISLEDIALKLGLENTSDIECIVSKAISDGIITSKIDSKKQTVVNTSGKQRVLFDPKKTFHDRVSLCLQLYNNAVKSMQYPDTEDETKVEEAEARRKEHQEQLARAEKEGFEGYDTDLW